MLAAYLLVLLEEIQELWLSRSSASCYYGYWICA